MKKEQIRLRGEAYRIAGIIAITAAVLFVCSILGTKHNTDCRLSVMKASIAESESESVRESEEESAEEAIRESIREETAVHEMELSYLQEQLLKLLFGHIESGDLEGAARVMMLNSDQLETLFSDGPADGFFIFDGSRMTDQTDGKGLVFTRASTVFCGEFKDGRPDGECLALQVLGLEEGVRYDYSKGSWKDGRMEGSGESGYDYYEGVEGGSAKKVVKSGTFAGDLMEGTMTYTSTNGEGESTSWTMDVKDGVIVTDDRWVRETGENGTEIYRLMSDTNSSHAYIMEVSAAGEVRWMNMIKY